MSGDLPYVHEQNKGDGMPESTTRSTRIEARISQETLALVKRTAEIEGRSISDFVVTAAQAAARRTIAEVEIISLSRKAQEQFAALLLDPPRPSQRLRKAFKHHRRLIGELR
jgi:uncharacterized protein (DUF1778 family)